MYLSSISIELGTDILDHNNRKFIAENVDRERTKNNVELEIHNFTGVYRTS